MSERIPNVEIPQQDLWRWEINGINRDLAPQDPTGVDYKDFRVSEARTIFEQLSDSKRVIFARTSSGYGITQFLIPKLSELMGEADIEHYHAELLDDGYIAAAKKMGQVVIIDEIGQSAGGPEGGFKVLDAMLNENQDLKAILMSDDQLSVELSQKLSKYDSTNQISRVEVKPKLFNLHQAAQYGLNGNPRREPYNDNTFFDGLNQKQALEIIKYFAEENPLHFRLLYQFRSIGNFYKEKLSYRNRLSRLKSGEWDYDIRALNENDWRVTGMRRK